MYNRTQNENGTYNTRCLHCFMTVASAVESEVDLNRFEEHHICPEMVLAQMLLRKDVLATSETRN